MSESRVQTLIRLEAANLGYYLWRNNCGAMVAPDGRLIRYGLANDSKQMNETIKSSDLIGIKPVIITADMIGKTLGVFLSREIKHENWVYTRTDREIAQKAWIDLINSLGGDAAFATGTGTL